MGEAWEQATVTRKAGKNHNGKNKEDENRAKSTRAVENTATHTTAHSDTKQTKEAIGEAVKAMEDSMGAKTKQTNNKTKNQRDIVHATELNAGMKVTGLANLTMALITACNYKNKNVKLELIKVENRASSQIERPTLVIAISDTKQTKEAVAMATMNAWVTATPPGPMMSTRSTNQPTPTLRTPTSLAT